MEDLRRQNNYHQLQSPSYKAAGKS